MVDRKEQLRRHHGLRKAAVCALVNFKFFMRSIMLISQTLKKSDPITYDMLVDIDSLPVACLSVANS